jgi:hypothetical protein
MGFGRTKSIYQGDPSPEVDDLWDDLYNSKLDLSLLRIASL